MSTDFAKRVLDLTNAFRAENNLPALSLNPTIATAAQKHSQNMATPNTFFSHWDSRNWSEVERNNAEGYTGLTIGENISAGQTPEQVVEGWKASSGHRANLLNRDATEIGIGYYQEQTDADGDGLTHYTTQVFGVKNGHLPAPRANVLVGTDGNDTLTGSAGTQYLVGSKGNDTLTGGPGTDYFIFTALNQGVDRITDYNPAEDKIYFIGRDFMPTGGMWPQAKVDFSTGMLSVNGTNLVQLPANTGYSTNTQSVLSGVPGL